MARASRPPTWPVLLLVAAAVVASALLATHTATSAVSLLAKQVAPVKKVAGVVKAKTASLEEAKKEDLPTFASAGLESYNEAECAGVGRYVTAQNCSLFFVGKILLGFSRSSDMSHVTLQPSRFACVIPLLYLVAAYVPLSNTHKFF
jgi:hypothetical protein